MMVGGANYLGAGWRQHSFLCLPGLSDAAISNNARPQCAKYHRLTYVMGF